MQYEIKYTCGHEKIVKLFGLGQERKRKIAWFQTQKCWDCAKSTEPKAQTAASSKEITITLKIETSYNGEMRVRVEAGNRAPGFQAVANLAEATKWCENYASQMCLKYHSIPTLRWNNPTEAVFAVIK